MDTLREKKRNVNFMEGLNNYCKNHGMEKCGYLIDPSCNGYGQNGTFKERNKNFTDST